MEREAASDKEMLDGMLVRHNSYTHQSYHGPSHTVTKDTLHSGRSREKHCFGVNNKKSRGGSIREARREAEGGR